jgi:hypothetical protein
MSSTICPKFFISKFQQNAPLFAGFEGTNSNGRGLDELGIWVGQPVGLHFDFHIWHVVNFGAFPPAPLPFPIIGQWETASDIVTRIVQLPRRWQWQWTPLVAKNISSKKN